MSRMPRIVRGCMGSGGGALGDVEGALYPREAALGAKHQQKETGPDDKHHCEDHRELVLGEHRALDAAGRLLDHGAGRGRVEERDGGVVLHRVSWSSGHRVN